MPDILDKIIERLQPSTLPTIANYKTDSFNTKYHVYNSVSDARQIKFNHISEEIHRKIFNLKSQTTELVKFLEIFERELERLKSLQEPFQNKGNAKAYEDKIKQLEVEIENLFAITGGVSYINLYNDVEYLFKQIGEIKNKISEVKKKFQSYEDFPPNLEEGKMKISAIKEKITSLRKKEICFKTLCKIYFCLSTDKKINFTT